MTKDERKIIAADLLGLIFKLRPSEPEESDGEDDPDAAFNGNAWVMSTLEEGIARAICASIGPDADPEDILEAHKLALLESITKAQAEFRRARFAQSAALQNAHPRSPFGGH